MNPEDQLIEDIVAEAKKLNGGGEPNSRSRAGERSGASKSSKLLPLSTIKPRATDWLWNNRIPRGAQTINTGLPGTGKSQQLIDIVAHVTKGADWPDGAQCACGDVILLSAEDALANTVVPRLQAAGADINRVLSLPLIRVDAKHRAFLLTEDLDELERHLVAHPNILLVGIDPVTAFMGTGKIDSHKTTDVRGVLGPLSTLAEDRNVAIYTVTHPPKASTSAINAFVGSQAFIAAARVGYLTVEEKDDLGRHTGRCLVSMVETNLGPKMPTLAYRLAQVTVGEDERDGRAILGSYVVWDGQVDVTADQALAASTGQGKRNESTAKDTAAEFLQGLLAKGRMAVTEIEELARSAGMLGKAPINKDKPFRDAKLELGVQAEYDGHNRKWYWGLGKAPSTPQGAPSMERAPCPSEGALPPDERSEPQPDGERLGAPILADPARQIMNANGQTGQFTDEFK